MRSIRPDRLIRLRNAAGLSQEELAELAGVGQSTIQRLETGETKTPRDLISLAKALNTTPEYLVGESDDAGPDAILLPVLAAKRDGPSDTVAISEFNVAYGLGATFIHEGEVKSRRRVFSRSWVRQFTESPFDKLFWATGNGTSMMPAILDNDILLIDTEQQTPRMWDQIWAIEMGGMGMIKSLRPTKDGGMKILSISSDWPDETAYDGEMNVIGRVVAVVRKL